MVTDRMLGMFSKKPKPQVNPASSASRPGADGSEPGGDGKGGGG